MIKCSVIIPVYNGEKQIRKAVESVQCQTYNNWELIIINDGSKDKTGEVCDELQKEDERIKVIHTINQGQGLARNIGLSMAKGEYVWFADADDTLLPKGMEIFINIAEQNKYDIISALYYRQAKSQKTLITIKTKEGTVKRKGTKDERERFHSIKTESIFGYLWNKVYRRQFLEDNQIKFDDIRKVYMEDQLFNLKAFGKAPNYFQCCEPVYCYHVDTDFSSTRMADEKIANKNREMLREYERWLRNNKIIEEERDLLTALTARVICWSLIKNIPYEGVSFKNIHERLKCFLQVDSIRDTIEDRNAYKNLKLINSLLQKSGYIVLFFMLRKKMHFIVACLFTVTAPFLGWYSRQAVK